MAAENDSLLRILVSTDNHLGVWEKEEDRKHDSFQAFEEVLQLAVEHRVDLLLLGGDLFHDNKPSPTTINRTIALLQKYCLGDSPVQIRILNSNQADIFVSGCVNFDNPNINIGLPVFTIHGNHDDPSGADNLSAVDLLSTCGLVNYFGKVLLGGNNIGTIKLQPVLLQKGDTKLALYGLGNVRDERLGRLFQTPGAVQWLRPASTPEIGQEDWLNVFVLHQNRVQHGPSAKNCLQERHLPDFLDLVIWGHEHECMPSLQDLQKPSGNDRVVQVLQPGSSVATALSEGEAKPKHAFLLECHVDKWRTTQLALNSVRPFMWDSISLAAVSPPLDPEDTQALTAVLERKVNAMIQQANRSAAAANPPATAPNTAATATAATGTTQQQQQQQKQTLPLIRLRVDYTGFGTVNSQRFGQKYVGRVANPHDMLLWAKAAAKRAKKEGQTAEEADLAAGLGLSHARPEQLDQARIEDLVSANLQANLDILAPDDLAQALHLFVEKEEKTALADCVTRVLQHTQVQVLSRQGGPAATAADSEAGGTEVDGVAAPVKDEDIAEVINLCVQQRAASKQHSTQQQPEGLAFVSAAAAAAGGAAVTQEGADPDLLIDGDENDSDENRDPSAAAAAGGKGRGGSRAGGRGSMPPPAPKAAAGRQRKGAAAAAAGGLRQSGLMEAFARGGSQGVGVGGTSPQGKTGSNLNGFLTTTTTTGGGGGGGGTPSQATSSRSRSAVGSAARGKGGRGGARGRGRGGRGGARSKAAAAESEEMLDSDDGDSSEGVEEGISDSDGEEERPKKRARGTASRPTRAAAQRQVSYNTGDDDEFVNSDDNDDATQQQPRTQRGTQQQTRRTPAGGRRTASAAAAARAESISQDSLSLSEPIEDSEYEEEGEEATAAAAGAKKGGRAGATKRAAGASQQRGGSKRQKTQQQQQQQAQQTQGTAGGGGSMLGPQSVDGGYIDSDSDGEGGGGGAGRGGSAAAPAPSSTTTGGGGGRRRVLPGSLAS